MEKTLTKFLEGTAPRSFIVISGDEPLFDTFNII